MMRKQLLEMSGIAKSYSSDVQALTDVSLTIAEGECVGLVGESGSGKSTLAKLILGLEKPDRGSIMVSGVPFHTLKGRALRLARQHVQVVFQDPAASLNPRLPIWKTVIEPLENYPEAVPELPRNDRNSKRRTASLLLDRVGLGAGMLDYYPHQLSGGQKQRVAIARGLSLQPKLLICDEPTSSLDVSIQAQILNLLKELQREFHMSYLFISHDIASVRYMSDRIAVLKDGQLADLFDAEELFSPGRHDYTRMMVQAATL